MIADHASDNSPGRKHCDSCYQIHQSLYFPGSHCAISSISFVPPAIAVEGDYARFHQCQRQQARNSLKWYRIASGTEDEAVAVYSHSRSFHTKACFSKECHCRIWVKRIRWEIPTMDELRTVYCKRIR